MDLGNLNLFIKMIAQEYPLTDKELEVLTNRLLADDKEFEKVWIRFKNKERSFSGGVDSFKQLLMELVS